MKTKILLPLLALFSSLLFAAAPLRAELVIELRGLNSMSREDSTGVARGDNWSVANTNWMTATVTSQAVVGDINSYSVARRQDTLGDYSGMIVTGSIFDGANRMQSWKGIYNSFGTTPKEFGNRFHLGWRVYGTDGETFRPSEATFTVVSEIRNQSGIYVADGAINYTVTIGSDLNASRRIFTKGADNKPWTADDVPSGATSNTYVDMFAYTGQGVGLLPGGNGTAQEKINNALNYARNNGLRLKATATIPGRNKINQAITATQTFIIGPDAPTMTMQPITVSSTSVVLAVTTPWQNTSYGLETSDELLNWSAVTNREILSVTPTGYLIRVPITAGDRRQFYRLRY